MPMWNPWRGCKKRSDGCLHCYIHKGDAKRGVDTSIIVKTKDFDKPIARLKKGGYKMKSGLVYLGFSTDFLIEEADEWRDECWKMIKERSDCNFLFLTKRIERFAQCMPEDWGNGYENVTVCCTIENQRNADKKLSVFSSLPIKHKCITAQPLIERVNLEPYLDGVELVVVGGESDKEARPLDYDWVLDIREQCIRKHVDFEFRQCGTHFIKDGRQYKLQTKDLCRQARLADINYRCEQVTLKNTNQLIGCCGLDCEKCDARIATLNNDNELRAKTAALWTKLNGVEITADMINCTGCRIDGAKTPFCDKLCSVHNCVREKGIDTCADCGHMNACPTLGSIAENSPVVLENLKRLREVKQKK